MSVQFSPFRVPDSSFTCVICMEPFQEGENALAHAARNTHHAFHAGCITPWTNSGRGCPVCREGEPELAQGGSPGGPSLPLNRRVIRTSKGDKDVKQFKISLGPLEGIEKVLKGSALFSSSGDSCMCPGSSSSLSSNLVYLDGPKGNDNKSKSRTIVILDVTRPLNFRM